MADDVIRPSDDIKRRLRAGEPLTGKQIAADYDVTPSLLGTAIAALQTAEGLRFTKTKQPGPGNPKRYQRASDVTGVPIHMDEADWGKGDNVAPSLQANKAKKLPKPKLVPKPPKPKSRHIGSLPPIDVPVPALGTHLRVALLMVSDDGVVTIGVNNGIEAWTAEVIGYTKREEVAPDGD
jgi:hypothetical protein